MVIGAAIASSADNRAQNVAILNKQLLECLNKKQLCTPLPYLETVLPIIKISGR